MKQNTKIDNGVTGIQEYAYIFSFTDYERSKLGQHNQFQGRIQGKTATLLSNI